MKKIKWFAGEVEVVEIEGRFIALDGWNGEKYLDCWEVEEVVGDTAFGVKEDGLEVQPVYEEVGEDDFEIIGCEFC